MIDMVCDTVECHMVYFITCIRTYLIGAVIRCVRKGCAAAIPHLVFGNITQYLGSS